MTRFQATYHDVIFGRGKPAPRNAHKVGRPQRWTHCARRWLKGDYESFQLRKLIYPHHCRLCEVSAKPFHRNKAKFA